PVSRPSPDGAGQGAVSIRGQAGAAMADVLKGRQRRLKKVFLICGRRLGKMIFGEMTFGIL
ncbi:MAG: hypothetical protein LBH76_05875, partial [Propionibacteriaceae bacterium]|nr:hypothetical protein [Propionibacteriaceae bacterium]